MSDIDQVSQQIGSLTAMVSETNRKADALFSRQDRMQEEVIEQRGAIKLLGSQLIEHKTVDTMAHARFEATGKDVEAIKNRGKGFIVGLTLVGGGGGLAGLAAAWKVIVGG